MTANTIHPAAQNIIEDFGLRLCRRSLPLNSNWLGQIAARECARTLYRMREASGHNNGKSVV